MISPKPGKANGSQFPGIAREADANGISPPAAGSAVINAIAAPRTIGFISRPFRKSASRRGGATRACVDEDFTNPALIKINAGEPMQIGAMPSISPSRIWTKNTLPACAMASSYHMLKTKLIIRGRLGSQLSTFREMARRPTSSFDLRQGHDFGL